MLNLKLSIKGQIVDQVFSSLAEVNNYLVSLNYSTKIKDLLDEGVKIIQSN